MSILDPFASDGRDTRQGWLIFRLQDMDVRFHWSLLLLLAYVFSVVSLEFPGVVYSSEIEPILVTGHPWLWATIFSASLVLSVVIHEAADALSARAMGVRVRSVTLMMLGGVSEMGPTPGRRYGELKMALAGPLLSLSIGAIFLAVEQNTSSPNLAFLSHWLGRLNLTLGVFNLLPAFPLDGGRAFRSVLAARVGVTRATHIAIQASKGLAWLLGIAGFFSANILLLLIAFFVYSAATSELAISVSRDALQGIPARDAGVRTPVLNAESTLSEVARQIAASHSRVLPISTPSGAGVIGMRHLSRIPRRHWGRIKAQDVMSESPRVVDASTPLEEIVHDVASSGVLPFSDGGKVVGIIRYTDLADLIEFKSLEPDTRAA